MASRDPVPEIRAYPDGPLLVRGSVVLLDESQRRVCEDRDVIALCRCGRSKLAPLCDGSHRRGRRVPARAAGEGGVPDPPPGG